MTKKRRIVTALILCGALAALLLLLNAIPFDRAAEAIGGLFSTETTEVIRLAEPDYDADIFKDEEYIAKYRVISYTEGALTVELDGEDALALVGTPARLFVDYFDAIIRGDSETLNGFFTDDFWHLDDAHRYSDMTMQRVYDIKVVLLESVDLADEGREGVTRYAFCVSYRIMKSDGTFRRDLPSDTARAQVYELLEDQNGILINSIGSLSYKNWNDKLNISK